MGSSPSLSTRLMAAIRGEVSASDLEGLRAAGSGCYDTLLRTEDMRRGLVSTGADAWNLPAATSIRLLAVWCAFANQKLGEAFLDADAAMDPQTVGYVPPVTADQVEAFLTEVEPWLRHASRAEVDPQHRIDEPLPHRLPDWVKVEPCPMAHLHAMLAAGGEIIQHAELAVFDLQNLGGDKHPEQFGRIQAELADAQSSFRYASTLHERLMGRAASPEMHERTEQSLKRAIESAYLVGQLSAMPMLTDVMGRQTPRQGRRSTVRPGDRDFDPWCLTDPASRRRWKGDPSARRAIGVLWDNDPDPAQTLAIQAEIDAAEARGDIVRSGQGNFYCCPWSAIYQVVNPVTIGGRRIRRGRTFTFDVSAEEMAEGGKFKREILVADFSPTSQIDYCNP